MVLDFIDKNGLIKPRRAWQDSGNGVLYTVVYNLLQPSITTAMPVSQLYKPGMGVLWRTPTNGFGQESNDDYLAFATWCLRLEMTTLAYSVCRSSIKKLGFMQNSFEPGDKLRSFLWRFPFLWLVFIAATMDSSSLLRLPIRYAARALTLFNTLNLNDANSVQLQWLQYKALEIMGDVKPMNSFLSTIQSRGTSLDQVMAGYYDEGHPILEGFAREKPRT